MKPTFTIRPAQHKDAAALTDLIYRSKASNGYDAAFMAACAEELRVSKEDVAEGSYWIAEQGKPLGCVCLQGEGEEGEVHAFFIAPEHKRRGIGRALWAVARDAALAQGMRSLVLDADPAAVPFYEALGFVTVEEKPSGSIPGRMLPHMRLVL